jgi:alpha-L-fucosidase 2
VSAARKSGATQWVRVKSLAGEPCRINPGLAGEVKATVPLKKQGNGIYELDLLSGGEALLYTGSEPPVPVVEPVAADPAQTNFWGVK